MIAKKLTLQQKILVAGTLFGMFFGHARHPLAQI